MDGVTFRLNEATGHVWADFTMLPAVCATYSPATHVFITNIKRIDTAVSRGKAYPTAALANTMQATKTQ